MFVVRHTQHQGVPSTCVLRNNHKNTLHARTHARVQMCARAPLVMDADLLQDLVAYKAYKRKGVAMAARSILQLFRDVNPALLARRDRGRDAKSSMASNV